MGLLLHEYIVVGSTVPSLLTNEVQCKFCGKTAKEISHNIQNMKNNSILLNKINEILKIENDILLIKSINEIVPCITEDEYIIKSLLE